VSAAHESAHSQDPLNRNLAVSLGLHAAVVLVLVIKAIWIPSEEIMLRNAIRVDVVAMPDKIAPPPPMPEAEKPAAVKPETVKQPPKAETAPPKVSTKKKETATDVKKAEETQKKAMDRLKAMQALERVKSEVTERKIDEKIAKAPTYKGNVVNQGDSLTGLDKIEFDRYLSGLENRIRANWQLPGWLSEAQLKAQVLVLIDASGQVLRRQVYRSSGNDVFDTHMLDAVDKSAPFPQPPSRLKDVLASKGIIFNFPDL
jgi:colicin import membrane protein